MRDALAVAAACSVFFLMLAVHELGKDVTALTVRLNAANAELTERKVIRPSEQECAAWLFNTDLIKAKARICGTKEKSPGSR